MKFRWSPSPAPPSLVADLAARLNISPLLARCLVNRELENPEIVSGFLEPRLKNLADPFLLPDMTAAVERLFESRERGERVVIFGDYDVDGVTSTALLLEFLRALGWQAEYYLPHRLAEGYGLTVEAVERCLNRSPTRLLLAVDCGSNAADCIDFLRRKGTDVIVLDHHQVSSPAPAAVALVNPQVRQSGGERLSASSGAKQPIASSPARMAEPAPGVFTDLCSVGLAFKLSHALLKHARRLNLPCAAEYDLRPLLDLVALGTIADLVPLRGENRILVTAGLERLNRTERPGLIALKAVARCSVPLGVYEVGYQLAPRLNAAGRLETAEDALRLLLSHNVAEARQLAETLEARNRERQQIEKTIAQEAISLVRSRFKPEQDFVIVEGDGLWHVGVVGIVASRVLHQFHRPTIIIGGEGLEWRGSGRSIAGFDLAAALRECSDLLIRHGGHAMAAGLTIQRENIENLRVRLNEVARRGLTLEQLQPLLRLDAEVRLGEVSLECMSGLGRLDPTGQGNPPVNFYTTNVRHQRPLQRMGAENQHVKMWVTDGVATHEAVWWGAGDATLPAGDYDLAFTPQINDYGGNRRIQLKVHDWRPSPAAKL